MKEAEAGAPTMRTLGVWILLLLAGCSAPANDSSEGGSCLERFAGPRGANAALLDSLQDPPDVAAERLAAAMGDELRGAPRIEADALEWDTRDGTLRHERRGEADVRLAWRPAAGIADPSAAILAALDASSAPPDRAEVSGSETRQSWKGEAIAGTGARVADGALTLGPLYDFDTRSAEAPRPEVDARATEALACDGADADAKARGLAVREASLVRVYASGDRCAEVDIATTALVALAPCVTDDTAS